MTALEEQIVALNQQLQTLQKGKETTQMVAATLREQLSSSLQVQEALLGEITKGQASLERANREKTCCRNRYARGRLV